MVKGIYKKNNSTVNITIEGDRVKAVLNKNGRSILFVGKKDGEIFEAIDQVINGES